MEIFRAYVLDMMDQATAPYSEELVSPLLVYLVFKREETKAWQFFSDHLMKRFFKSWKRKGVLTQAFIDAMKEQVNSAFDIVMLLEGKDGDNHRVC